MSKLINILFLLILFTGQHQWGKAQDSLTLDQAIFLAKTKSLSAAEAKRDISQAVLRYKAFRGGLKPQLSLSGVLPNYSQSFQEVVQPDGQISFQPIRYDNSFASAQIDQQILPTGGNLFVRSDLQRFDDLVNKNTQYNGLPVRIGITQSLTGFNPIKWENRLNHILYAESQRTWIQEMERVALETIQFYFNVLLAQTDLQISTVNLTNNEKLFRIAEERLALGKVSKEDFLQLKLEWVNAKRDKREAEQQWQAASSQLRSWLGIGNLTAPIRVTTPATETAKSPVNFQEAIRQAFANRPELKSFERLQTEAKQSLVRAKTQNRFQADLQASVGLASSGSEIDQIYREPQEEQNLSLSFSIPLVDWGQRKAAVKVAEIEKEYWDVYVDNQTNYMQSEIVEVVSNYNKMLYNIQLIEEAQLIALERFNISTERFLMGHISTTEYTLSQKSKDDMQRTYTQAIRNYWFAHYQLRLATLYDFETDQIIGYNIN